MTNQTQINPFKLVGKKLQLNGETKKVDSVGGKFLSDTAEIRFKDGSKITEEELLENHREQIEEAMI